MVTNNLSLWIVIGTLTVLAPGWASGQTPKKGGVLNFAVTSEPPNYDCHANSSHAFIHSVRPHYSTLLKFDPANYPNVKGDIAESWQVSRDGLQYTFKLRKNVKFHDGTPLTSVDVKASYERIINPPQGVISLRRAAYSDVAAIEMPDSHTVVFRLKEKNASILSSFASPFDCIYNAAKLKQDPKFPGKNILGTGPFKFVEHAAGSHWVGERFKDYFESGKPYLDGFRAIYIRDTAARVSALQAGEILVEFRGESPADRDRLVSALGEKITVLESPWLCNLAVTFNTEKKPFSDARVRRALSLAIDRWKGAEALSKISIVRHVGGVLRPGYEYAAKESEFIKYPGWGKDITTARDEARKLLKEAGVSNLGFKFTNRNVPMPYSSVGVFLIDQWRQIGVAAEHEQLDSKLYLAALRSGNFEVALDPNCSFMDEPNQQLIKYISTDKSTISYARHRDSQLDELYKRQSHALEQQERYKIVREFEKRALEQAYTVPVLWFHRVIVHWKKMRGWHITPSHYLNQDLADVWLDQ